MAGGRRGHHVWQCFGPPVQRAGQKGLSLPCRGCGVHVAQVVVRAVLHANKCLPLQAAGLWKGQHQPLPVVVTTRDEGDAITTAIANAIIGLNLPFAVVNHPAWRDMVRTLRPGSRTMCASTLRTSVLQKIFLEDRQKWESELSGQLVGLSCDGWTSPSGPMIARSVFFSCIPHPSLQGDPCWEFALLTNFGQASRLWVNHIPLSMSQGC